MPISDLFMKEDIGRQPDVLRDLAPALAALHNCARDIAAVAPVDRVWVIGCGDGLFAAEAVAQIARRSGLDWCSVGPMELLVEPDRVRPGDIAVLMSMSGNVDRTVEAAQLVHDRGLSLLAIVNGDGGRLGQLVHDRWSMDLPDLAPFLCGTASFTATIAALSTVIEGLSGRTIPDLANSAATLARADHAANKLFSGMDLGAVTGLRFLASGATLGLARYGAAKCVEVAARPVWSADLEEFAHSQFWTMSPHDLVVLIATSATEAAYADASADALAQMGTQTLAFDCDDAPVSRATMRLTVPQAGPAGLCHLPGLQHLAYAVGTADGLDPNRRLHLKTDEARFRTSRLLTRRSLLGSGT
ncbi:SIS domain-containing protein [Paracoccus sp. PAMC 22219]|uniref:SIS domain-containing protein n=1 Tax=Paracoccus sp. PAMC 22219 TaxID=1569209 RepID=UPI0005A768C1|nr:SIS domain-containing protein [Paracoccus sp. PAMC 22219]